MLRDDLYAAISELPAIDVHSHLPRDRMVASDLGAVVFYHMLRYPLRAAGVEEDKLWPGENIHGGGRPYDDLVERWPSVAGTGFGWTLRTILRELYGFDEPIAAESLPRLRSAFEAKTGQPDWAEQVLRKGRIVRELSSELDVAPLKEGEYDGGIRFTIEAAPTMGGYRESDPWRRRLERLEEKSGCKARTLKGMREAVAQFYDRFDWSGKKAFVSWVSAEADFTPVDDAVIDSLIADSLGGKEPDVNGKRLLEAALIRAVCLAIGERTNIFQLVYGTQFLTPGRPHPVARAAPQFASSMAHLFGEFPGIHFNILNGFEADEPVWCSMCLGYENVSLSSFWWQTFYPSVMHASWHRRLDMVPTTRLMSFFSDGYCVDWIYGRMRMTERVLANVLAEKVERGFYTSAQAVQVALEILFETPRRVFLPDEKIET